MENIVGETPSLIVKGDKRCAACGQQYDELLELPFYARYIPVAIVGVCEQHGIFFRSPSESDLERIREADARRDCLDFGPLSDFAVMDGPKSGDLLRHNIRSYLDVFSSRQLLYLHTAIGLFVNTPASTSSSWERWCPRRWNSMQCSVVTNRWC